jgi:hypothetical protein
MNPPKTKLAKRFSFPRTFGPLGKFKTGIRNSEIQRRVGDILTVWPHVEERMVPVFAELLGLEFPGPARLVFRSIVNHKARADIMRAMLQKSPEHVATSQSFDKAIDEFDKLADIRNGYAHGLWYTHEDGMRVFLEEETRTYFTFMQKRRVTETELKNVHTRINELLSDRLPLFSGRLARAKARALKDVEPF